MQARGCLDDTKKTVTPVFLNIAISNISTLTTSSSRISKDAAPSCIYNDSDLSAETYTPNYSTNKKLEKKLAKLAGIIPVRY